MLEQVFAYGTIASGIKLENEFGRDCVKFTLAMKKESSKDLENESDTALVPITVCNPYVMPIVKELKQGSLVSIIGKLSRQKLEDGSSVTEIIADEIVEVADL